MPNPAGPGSTPRSIWTISISSKARSRAVFVFRPRILSFFRRRNCLADSPRTRAGVASRRTSPRSNRFQRTERRRSRCSSRTWRRVLRASKICCRAGAAPAWGGGNGNGQRTGHYEGKRSARPRICRRSEALRAARAGLSRFALRRRRQKIAAAQLAGRCEMGPGETKRGRVIFDYAGKMLARPGRARNAARPRLRPGHQMAARIRAFVSFPRNARPD